MGRSSFIAILFLWLAPPLIASVISHTPPHRQQTEVLFLSSSDPDLPDIATLIEEAETQILEGRSTPIHFTLEYFDPSWLNGESSRNKELVSFLQEKHPGEAFDLLITIGDQTTEFAEQTRTRLFPHAALLFCLVGAADDKKWLMPKFGRTGVVRKLNYIPTLQLALQENPGTRKVVVVSGSSDFDKLEMKTAREQFYSSEPNIEFQYWTDLKLADAKSRLASVGSDSVVLFLDFLGDPEGEQLIPSRALPSIAQTANRPLYGTYASFVGNGVVGGSVADLRDLGRVLGQQGARILNGEKPEAIPVATGEFQRNMFDWHELHRWGIPADQLPPESSVLNWESSPWELYRWRILALCAGLVIETLLIFLLLHIRSRRRRAEEALKKSEEKFSKAFRQSPMAISFTDAKTHRYIDVNETFERMTGCGRSELIGRSALEAGIWVDPSKRVNFVQELLAKGSMQNLEFLFRTKEGQTRIAQASAELIEIQGEPCVLGAASDITDRKHAEQALSESEKRFRLMADSAPVLMWLSGPDKLCTDFNKEWLRFTGRTMEQELGEGWREGVHPDDLQSFLQVCAQAFDARRNFAVEYRLRRHDGEYRWMLNKGVPRFLEDGGFAGYIGCCFDITDQKAAKAVQAELSGRLLQAQEEERSRIARELHDDINQRLALLANGLLELEEMFTDNKLAPQRNQIKKFWQLTSEIANEVHHLSHQLHPSKLSYLGLSAAVREVCQEFSKLHKIEVDCALRDVPNLNKDASLSLFRTVQESLRNVVKHSRAHHVTVELSGQANVVRLRISDDGVGFDLDHPQNGGLGLISMQERLRKVGGELSVRSRASLGTQIEAIVPTPAKHAKSA